MAYMVMTEKNKITVEENFLGRKETNIMYLPDYDYLIENSSCEAEANVWKEAKNRKYTWSDTVGSTFTLQFVGAYLRSCGDWEILQYPYIEGYQSAEEINNELIEESSKMPCTYCVCNIGKRK